MPHDLITAYVLYVQGCVVFGHNCPAIFVHLSLLTIMSVAFIMVDFFLL